MTFGMLIPAGKFTFTHLWLFATFLGLGIGVAQDISDNSQLEDIPVEPQRHVYRRQAPSSSVVSFCLAPPQPSNGEHKLGQYYCNNLPECKVPEGTPLGLGSQLVYSCKRGYGLKGNPDVYCSARGEWSAIPECIEVRCASLNSESTSVSCTRFSEYINCDSPVPPETRAEVSCRNGYKKDTDFVTTRRTIVDCKVNGKWEPQPIRCVPVCGRTINQQQPLIHGGTPARIGDFPWHASIFLEKWFSDGSRKVFICGGTIIQTNLILTAAHCVYDEGTKTKTDPRRLFVITGNIFQGYDSPLHNPDIVRKATVKNVYTLCNYYGLIGNYASDIALLELQKPFEFSRILLPACLDASDDVERYFGTETFGRVAGFGRTSEGEISGILQTISVPYVPYGQCRASDDGVQNEALLGNDKFCAGYRNGSAVCEGDSGGGLVFKKGDLWYVRGIVSVGLGVNFDNGEKTCEKYSYSLYTKVSTYMAWIQDVLFYVERNLQYPSCSHHSNVSVTASTPPTAMSQLTATPTPTIRTPVRSPPEMSTRGKYNATVPDAVPTCLAPPQPYDGEWWLHPNSCNGKKNCKVPKGTPLRPSSRLIYKCLFGYKLEGAAEVFCRVQGTWTAIPFCTSTRQVKL